MGISASCWRAAVIFCVLAHVLSAATISGRIVEDHSGSPVASASVRIVKTGVRGLQADLETDGDGRFDAPELTEGEYRIDISKPNYLNATVRLRLTAGMLTNVRLIRCGVITGSVTDAQRQPLRFATVLAMPKPGGGLPLQPDFSAGHFATVDPRGNYRIHNLPPGQYAVAVSYGASTFAVGSSGSASTAPGLGSGFLFYPDNAHPQFLNISAGEERRNLDFAIQSASLHAVSGKVDAATAKDRFWLALSNFDQPALAVAVTQTEADGSFRFNGVSDGSYHLFAAKTSGARTGRGAFLHAEPMFARTRVNIVSQDVADLAVSPGQGRSATLVMRMAKSSGGGAGCPATAQVVLKPLEDWGVQLERRTSMSLEKAETLSTLAPARFIVSVTGLGDTCYSSANPILDLSGSADAGPIVVTVAPAGSIHGRLDTSGQSSYNFAVILLAEETGDDAPTVQVAIPDAESRFTFGGLRPGRYRIATEQMAKASQSRWLAEPGRMVEVEVHGATVTEVNLTAPPGDGRSPSERR
jgi:5-hydroxyisourate hydrolase-like protein (transthyretin family)